MGGERERSAKNDNLGLFQGITGVIIEGRGSKNRKFGLISFRDGKTIFHLVCHNGLVLNAIRLNDFQRLNVI